MVCKRIVMYDSKRVQVLDRDEGNYFVAIHWILHVKANSPASSALDPVPANLADETGVMSVAPRSEKMNANLPRQDNASEGILHLPGFRWTLDAKKRCDHAELCETQFKSADE